METDILDRMPKLHLVIDIGNSRVILCLFQGDEIKHSWSCESLPDVPLSFYEMDIRNEFLEKDYHIDWVNQITMSSVVPELTHDYAQMLYNVFHLEVTQVRYGDHQEVASATDHPSEMGTDLYCNAVAAFHLHKKGCIIVDLGTALTFTVVNAEGLILGVAIAPGIHTALKSLFERTAQLPQVPIKAPASSIGKNTTTAIQAGVIGGYIGMIRSKVSAIKAEFGQHYHVICTGGFSSELDELEEICDLIDPLHTLRGIRIYGEKVRENSQIKSY